MNASLMKIRACLPWTKDDKQGIEQSSLHSSTTLEEEEEDTYCIIESNQLCVDATLSLIKQQPVIYSDLIPEFKLVHDYLDQTCHQFDHARTIDQFANTDKKMGPELKSFMNFISNRYATCSWLRCIGLIMVAQKVLYSTPREVKKQLVQQTKIGREFVNYMQKALLLSHRGGEELDPSMKAQLVATVLPDHTHLFHLLRDMCHDFADSDKQFELAYEQIIYYFRNQYPIVK